MLTYRLSGTTEASVSDRDGPANSAPRPFTRQRLNGSQNLRSSRRAPKRLCVADLVGRPGLEPGTLGSRVHPDRCGGVLKRLDSSQICHLGRSCTFRPRRVWCRPAASRISPLSRQRRVPDGPFWTLPDALGNAMLGECWVKPSFRRSSKPSTQGCWTR
jgi:hypothetical protein